MLWCCADPVRNTCMYVFPRLATMYIHACFHLLSIQKACMYLCMFAPEYQESGGSTNCGPVRHVQ